MPTIDAADNSGQDTKLIFRKGVDFFFDIEYWDQPEDKGGVKVPLVDAWGVVQNKYDDTTIIDFADHLTVVDGTVELRIEGDYLATLDALNRGVYELFGRTNGDQDVTLWNGPAEIREDV